MAQKVKCENTECKFHTQSDGCSTTVRIGPDMRCRSFEKSFAYYFHAVWSAMNRSSIIADRDLTDDVRIGLYYVMEVFHLGFTVCERGGWRWIELHDGPDGPALTADEIVERDTDTERLGELLEEFNVGKLPGMPPEEEQGPGEKAEWGFGWLSPMGEFTESPWGDHEESAERIIHEIGLDDEYRQWRKNGDIDMILCRDFLTHAKGYCLIHDPSNDGAYIVTNIKPLTRRQREFLYEYFMDKGDRFRAEMYFKEDE